jgi:hypothetical protein
MLVRLMYASRAAVAIDQEELLSILRHAKAANAKIGITGALCLADGIFIQALEGGRDAVNRVYNKIAADSRHKDVMLLGYEEISERHFASWSMGQVNLSRANPALLIKYSECAKLDPYKLSGKLTMALFDELVATAAVTGQP